MITVAILKHIAVKNADYGDALDYLKYQHDERHLKPLLDENGNMMLREEFYLDGLNCNPETFDIECEMFNAACHKNQSYDEIKSHHYIISFDPADRDGCGLTGERAQAIGLEYAKANFPGHQALVCTHMDGHNGSGNIHVHIIINSLRKYDIEPQPFCERPIDSRAGYKHHLTRDYLKHLKRSLMEICLREKLHQVDLLSPAQQKITEEEYWAAHRGQEQLDKLNEKIAADGLTPMRSSFQTQKQFLRDAISEAAAVSTSFEMFQALLKEKYGITVKDHRGRYSYLHPERQKYITGRTLGSDFDREHLLALFAENEKSERNKTHCRCYEVQASISDTTQNEQKANVQDDPIAILFIKSDLRLVVDLQSCVKAQQSRAYAQKVKVSNLQQMAKTVAYVQEHGYDTRENLQSTYDEITANMHDARKNVKATEAKIKKVNEQIHYTGQYLANKPVYAQFLKSKNKRKFRQEHSTEMELYETAVKFLKAENPDGRIPSIKSLKAEKERLAVQRDAQYETYTYFKDYRKELRTVCSNVDAILGQGRTPEPERSKTQDRS